MNNQVELKRRRIEQAPIMAGQFGWSRGRSRSCPNVGCHGKLLVNEIGAKGCPQCGYLMFADNGNPEHLDKFDSIGEAIAQLFPRGNA